MSPEAMAALHRRCFSTPHPWSARDFSGFLDDPTVHLLTSPNGFMLLRVVAGEAEILTLAVAPEARRQGEGARLLASAVAISVQNGAETIFLEVAADNVAGLALYACAGFAETGRRKGYYRKPDGQRVDAILMSRTVSPTSVQNRT